MVASELCILEEKQHYKQVDKVLAGEKCGLCLDYTMT